MTGGEIEKKATRMSLDLDKNKVPSMLYIVIQMPHFYRNSMLVSPHMPRTRGEFAGHWAVLCFETNLIIIIEE